jgi:hypothetical protein
LLKANPLFDIRRAQQDPFIGKLDDRELRDFLTPWWTCQEQHGLVFNHVTVTNRSPFRITGVTVTISIRHSDGTKQKPKIQRLACLEIGARHRWDNLFKDVRLFGSNIRRVDVTVDCAEQRPPFGEGRRKPPPAPEFELVDEVRPAEDDIPMVEAADETPPPEEDVVLLEPAEEAPGPAGAKRAATAKAACPRCGFAGRQAWRRCPECGFVRKTRRS